MLFGGTELVRRVERAECAMLRDCVAEVALRSSREAFELPLAGGLAAFAGADAPLTKVAGLGFDGVPSDDELARVEREFGARGAPVQVELASLAEAGIAERLSARGYALVGFENVLGRRLDARQGAPTGPREGVAVGREVAPARLRDGVTVERARPDALEAWLDVVVGGFAVPDAQGVASHESFPRDAMRAVMRELALARGFALYVARRAGVAAGGASMHLGEGIAHLAGAATLPEHRRHGVQGALLERRLADAAREGCELAVVITLPGSKSQQNVQRQGFQLLYTRAILRRAAPGAGSGHPR